MDETKVEKLAHIERAGPPWRVPRLTECGIPLAGLELITRAQAARRVKEVGVNRALFSICYTCYGTASRNPEWADNPVRVMYRDFGTYRRATDETELERELRALEYLWSTHRDEYEQYMAAIDETPRLADARAARRRRGR